MNFQQLISSNCFHPIDLTTGQSVNHVVGINVLRSPIGVSFEVNRLEQIVIHKVMNDSPLAPVLKAKVLQIGDILIAIGSNLIDSRKSYLEITKKLSPPFICWFQTSSSGGQRRSKIYLPGTANKSVSPLTLVDQFDATKNEIKPLGTEPRNDQNGKENVPADAASVEIQKDITLCVAKTPPAKRHIEESIRKRRSTEKKTDKRKKAKKSPYSRVRQKSPSANGSSRYIGSSIATPSRHRKSATKGLQPWPWCLSSSDSRIQLPEFWRSIQVFFKLPGDVEGSLKQLLDAVGFDYGQLSADVSLVPDLGVLPASLRRLMGNTDSYTPKSYDIGQTVFVEKRTWPGMNKLGGYGRIRSMKQDGDSGDILYTVCYVLGGVERDISSRYIHLSDAEGQEKSYADEIKPSEDMSYVIDILVHISSSDCTSTFVDSPLEKKSERLLSCEQTEDSLRIFNLENSSESEGLKDIEFLSVYERTSVLEHDGVDEIYGELCDAQLHLSDISINLARQIAILKLRAEETQRQLSMATTNLEKETEYLQHEISNVNESNQAPHPDTTATEQMIKKISNRGECVMCLIPGDNLAQTESGLMAHPMCVIYTPETYFENHIARGIESIPRDRYRLRCTLCKQRQGSSKVQCGNKKCVKAYHVHCAHANGLLTRTDGAFQCWCPKHLRAHGMETYVDTHKARSSSYAMKAPVIGESNSPRDDCEEEDRDDSMDDTPVESQVEDPKHKEPRQLFDMDSLVRVERRFSPGINKEGGIGRIKARYMSDNGNGHIYDVTYVLTGKTERGIHERYIWPEMMVDKRIRRRRSISQVCTENTENDAPPAVDRESRMI